jgi:hypothetical protein
VVLGFHPEESLVLVVVDGEVNLHARVDLPPGPEEFGEVCDVALTAARRAEAVSVVLVAYSDDEWLATALGECVSRELEDDGVEVVAALRADGERWFWLDGRDDPLPEGHPYDAASHPIAAAAVLTGRVTYRSREELRDTLVGTDPDATEAVAAAAAEHGRRLGRERQRSVLVAEGSWVRDRVRRYVATREPLDHDEAGRMVRALEDVDVRDVAWSEMRREDAVHHVDLWRDVVRRTPHEHLAAPAALLGFAAWLAGDGALAWCAVDRCQEADPDYTLARLLTQTLAAAVPPSSWRPMTADDLPLFTG